MSNRFNQHISCHCLRQFMLQVCCKSSPLSSHQDFGRLCESLCLLLQESWGWHPCTLLNAFHGPALTSLWHWQNYCCADFSSLCPFLSFFFSFCFILLGKCNTFEVFLSTSHVLFSPAIHIWSFFFFSHRSRLVNWLWYPYNLVSFSHPRLCFFGLCHPSHHGQPAERGQ